MADTYEKDLGAKSSLTTSDYIRVVGSDNVSYKQLVSSVMSAMGINTSIDLGVVTDLNSTINNHTKTYSIDYYNSSASNKPSGNSGIVITQGNGNYRGQLVIDLGGALFSRTYSTGTLSSWGDGRRMIRYLVTIPSITIGSSGYTSISSYYPGAQTGYSFLTAVCYNFGSISPASAFTVLGNSNYVAGQPNATITNLQVAYIYAPAVEARP